MFAYILKQIFMNTFQTRYFKYLRKKTLVVKLDETGDSEKMCSCIPYRTEIIQYFVELWSFSLCTELFIQARNFESLHHSHTPLKI